MTPWRKAALYARVSTVDQSTEQQLPQLLEVARRRAAAHEVFAESGSTRRHLPVRDALMARARAGEFDAVIVWRLDRFGRDTIDLLMAVDELRARGVAFLSVADGVDPSTPAGELMLGVLASLAQYERSQISERTKERLGYLRERGVRLGRPRIAIDMKRARRLVLENKLSVRKLARALGTSMGTAARTRRQVLACQKEGASKEGSVRRRVRGVPHRSFLATRRSTPWQRPTRSRPRPRS